MWENNKANVVKLLMVDKKKIEGKVPLKDVIYSGS